MKCCLVIIYTINCVDNVSWPPLRVSKADILQVNPSSIRSEKGLMLEMPVQETFHGDQFTLSTQLIKQDCLKYNTANCFL